MAKSLSEHVESIDGQKFTSGDKYWLITRLLKLADGLEQFRIPLRHFNTSNLCPAIGSMNEFVKHIKQVNDADLDFPIILDDEGYVMDGRHRVAKALLEGKKDILAVRFDKDPTPCGHQKDDQ